MPRSKPSKVEEIRITLGTKERMLLEELSTSYRIEAITGKDSIVETLSDGTKIVGMLGTIGLILELLGITDVVNIDNDLQAKGQEIKEKIKENAKQAAVENADRRLNVEAIIKTILTPGFTPFRIADFGLDEIRDSAEETRDDLFKGRILWLVKLTVPSQTRLIRSGKLYCFVFLSSVGALSLLIWILLAWPEYSS